MARGLATLLCRGLFLLIPWTGNTSMLSVFLLAALFGGIAGFFVTSFVRDCSAETHFRVGVRRHHCLESPMGFTVGTCSEAALTEKTHWEVLGTARHSSAAGAVSVTQTSAKPRSVAGTA